MVPPRDVYNRRNLTSMTDLRRLAPRSGRRRRVCRSLAAIPLTLLTALAAAPPSSAQEADPKAEFLQALGRFSLDLDGDYGDEGARHRGVSPRRSRRPAEPAELLPAFRRKALPHRFAGVDRDGDVDLFVANYVDARRDNNLFCTGATARSRTRPQAPASRTASTAWARAPPTRTTTAASMCT